jgi:hypothetical protein
MLKKQVCYLIAIVSAVLLFFSCFSTPPGKIVFDPDLPEEQSTVVIFDGTIKVLQFNGIDVKDAWYPKGESRKNTVTLPAGYSAITLNYSFYMGSVYRNNLELRFNFEPEKEYAVGACVFRGESKGFLKGYNWTHGIGIWNKFSDIGSRDKAIKFWELGESPAD